MGLLSKFFGPPSHDDFAQLVVRALRADGERGAIAYDAATFTLVGGDEHVISLGNFYLQFTRVPRGRRDAFVRDFLSNMREDVEQPKNFADARQRLLPTLRSRCYFAFSNLNSRASGISPNIQPFRIIADTIALGLVLDYPSRMYVIGAPQVDAWGVSANDAIDVAIANLRARTEPCFRQHAPGTWVSAWNDSYDATRLLLPDVLTSLRVRGRHVRRRC